MCLVQDSILASKRPTGLALGFTLESADKFKTPTLIITKLSVRQAEKSLQLIIYCVLLSLFMVFLGGLAIKLEGN